MSNSTIKKRFFPVQHHKKGEKSFKIQFYFGFSSIFSPDCERGEANRAFIACESESAESSLDCGKHLIGGKENTTKGRRFVENIDSVLVNRSLESDREAHSPPLVSGTNYCLGGQIEVPSGDSTGRVLSESIDSSVG
jgi:hypothetical protein